MDKCIGFVIFFISFIILECTDKIGDSNNIYTNYGKWSKETVCSGENINWTLCYYYIKRIVAIQMPFYDDMVSLRYYHLVFFLAIYSVRFLVFSDAENALYF